MAIFTAIGLYIAQAVGFLAASAGFAFSTAVTIGAYAGQIGSALVALGVSRALTPKISIPTPEIQAIINQTDAPRRVYVGKNLAGGIRAFYHTRDSVLHQVVVLGHGRVEAFDALWCDGVPVTVDGSGNVTSGTTAGYVNIQTRNGGAMGGDYADMLSIFAGTWTPNHRLDGQATFYVQMEAPDAEDFSKAFPKSYNTMWQYVIRGQRIYDPRSVSAAYTDNAALVIRHYLQHADGYRLASSEISGESVSAMADVADQPVSQKAGGTAPSLRLWGYWTLDEEPASVLNRMYGSCGIRAYEGQDGRIGLIGGPFGTPSCTITTRDIADIRTMSAISEREGYNVLRPFFMSEAHKFEEAEVEAWRDEARLAQEGEVVTEYHMLMCPNQSQAMRLAETKMLDDNRAKVEIVTNLVGLKARFPRYHGQRHTIMLDYRPEDGSGRVIAGEYEVMDHEFDPVGLRCRIALARVTRPAPWTVAKEGTLIVAPETPGLSPPPPLVAAASLRVYDAPNGSKQGAIVVIATAVPGRQDLRLQAEYRRVGDSSDWRRMGGARLTAETNVVDEGATYQVRARWVGTFDGVDAWQNLSNVVITTNPTPPSAPTEVIVSPSGTKNVHISWRNPISNFYRSRVYRHTSSIFADATLVATVGGAAGQISEYTDSGTIDGVTYRYWVTAVNGSSVESAPAQSALITA